jgi:hypothetical protein
VSKVAELEALLESGCKVQKFEPAIFASDAEVNIVIVTLACPEGKTHVIRAYREEAHALRVCQALAIVHALDE